MYYFDPETIILFDNAVKNSINIVGPLKFAVRPFATPLRCNSLYNRHTCMLVFGCESVGTSGLCELNG